MSNRQYVCFHFSALAILLLVSIACSNSTAPSQLTQATQTQSVTPTVKVTPPPQAAPSHTPVPTVPTASGSTTLKSWQIQLTGVSREKVLQLSSSPGKVASAQEGFIFLLAKFKVANTTEGANTLLLDLSKDVVITDAQGKSYLSDGTMIYFPYHMHRKSTGGGWGVTGWTIKYDNGPEAKLDLNSQTLTITTTKKIDFPLTFAFAVPSAAADFQLQWSGLPKFNLK